MFYRPNFCCHCGEKIIRAKWTLLTSRRFCEFCEIEQKQHDLLPRAATVVALLVGAAGLTSYFRGSTETPAPLRSTPAQAEQAREFKGDPTKRMNLGPATNANNAEHSGRGFTNASRVPSNAASTKTIQRDLPQDSSIEPVYYCGAITRKGTPCTRRVKTKGRCWQHIGRQAPDRSRD
jgi:hypothetical protein